MTLPTQITAAVGFQVDAGDILRARGTLGVTTAAEFAGAWLIGAHCPRPDLVLHRSVVATGAGQPDVVGNRLHPCNLPVAGTALLGYMRWFRSVRVVATNTRLQGIVDYRIDLRKAGGSAWIVAVAERTIAPLAGSGQSVLGGSFGVRRCWPVADLARHGLMAGVAVGLHNLGVAQSARLAPGVANRLLLDGFDRCRPVVTSLAESLWQKEMPANEECASQHGKDNQQACQLLRHLGRGLVAPGGAITVPLPALYFSSMPLKKEGLSGRSGVFEKALGQWGGYFAQSLRLSTRHRWVGSRRLFGGKSIRAGLVTF